MNKGAGKFLSYRAVKKRLGGNSGPFVKAWERGELEIELYEPKGIDGQKPHSRDEVYVVVKGSGHFKCGSKITKFKEGDVLFAPAWTPHRFVDFSKDLSVWVIFYGPEGGDQP